MWRLRAPSVTVAWSPRRILWLSVFGSVTVAATSRKRQNRPLLTYPAAVVYVVPLTTEPYRFATLRACWASVADGLDSSGQDRNCWQRYAPLASNTLWPPL